MSGDVTADGKHFLMISPHFSQGFGRFAYTEAVQRAVDTRRAIEGPADILDSMLRSPIERSQFMHSINWDRCRHGPLCRRSRRLVRYAG